MVCSVVDWFNYIINKYIRKNGKALQKVIVKAANGVHARPASLIVEEASKFNADIKIVKEEKKFNAKNIMDLIASGLQFNDEVIIEANGEDKAEAVAKIKELFDNSFGE